jgi:hypothetical protein
MKQLLCLILLEYQSQGVLSTEIFFRHRPRSRSSQLLFLTPVASPGATPVPSAGATGQAEIAERAVVAAAQTRESYGVRNKTRVKKKEKKFLRHGAPLVPRGFALRIHGWCSLCWKHSVKENASNTHALRPFDRLKAQGTTLLDVTQYASAKDSC